MTKSRKGFKRLAMAAAAKPTSPKLDFCSAILKAMQAGTHDLVDEMMRDGLRKGLVSTAELNTYQGTTGSVDAHAWLPITTRASEMLRYGRPEAQLTLSGWQIANWCGQANPDLDPQWLKAARQACQDILSTGLDHRRPLGIAKNPAADGCKDLSLPEGVYMLRFSRDGDVATKLPGENLEHLAPNPDNITYEDTITCSFVQRTSPQVLLEATNHNWHDDTRHHPGCAGVAYFSAEPSRLDAFIESRPTLAIREDLFERAARGSMSVLDAVDKGFPVDLASTWRPTVSRLIHQSCHLSHGRLVVGLLDRGASPNRRSDEYAAPIHYLFRFAMNNKEADTELALRSMFENGLRIEDGETNQSHETPLHKAARHDWPVIASVLLAMGADPLFQNESGETPIDLAKDHWKRSSSSDCLALFDAWAAKNRIEKIRASAGPSP